MSTEAPFFIVGAGRSGTTLLRLMLAGHSRLHVPDETWFMRPLVAALPLAAELGPVQVERAVAIITGQERWPDMGFPADELRRQAQALRAPRLADLIGLVFRWHSARSGKPRIGDKTPHYFRIVPQLAAVFPTARFIHLVRDGRDVAISWIDAGWNRYHERGFEWSAAMRARRGWNTAALRGRIHEVRYEGLIGDPAAALREVCAFLGERFEPAMLDWSRRTALIAARDRHLHGRLGVPLSPRAVGVWRKRLRGWECFAIESCLHRQLRALGYRPRYAAAYWRPCLAAGGTLLRLGSPLLRRAVPLLQRHGMVTERIYL